MQRQAAPAASKSITRQFALSGPTLPVSRPIPARVAVNRGTSSSGSNAKRGAQVVLCSLTRRAEDVHAGERCSARQELARLRPPHPTRSLHTGSGHCSALLSAHLLPDTAVRA